LDPKTNGPKIRKNIARRPNQAAPGRCFDRPCRWCGRIGAVFRRFAKKSFFPRCGAKSAGKKKIRPVLRIPFAAKYGTICTVRENYGKQYESPLGLLSFRRLPDPGLFVRAVQGLWAPYGFTNRAGSAGRVFAARGNGFQKRFAVRNERQTAFFAGNDVLRPPGILPPNAVMREKVHKIR